jgi:hypothetical protein
VVSIYEDATSALLGSGVASSSPQPSGEYAGWYAWTVPVLSWSSAAGVFLPSMAGAGSLVFPTFAAAPSLPTMAGAGGMAEITYTSSATFSLPTMAGKGGLTAISITAVVGLPAMAGKGALVAPTIEAGGGGGVSVTDDFNRANGGLGANWTTVTGMGAPQINANKVRPQSVTGAAMSAAIYTGATFGANQYAEAYTPWIGQSVLDPGHGVRVRGATAANTCYALSRASNDNESEGYDVFSLFKFENGTATWIADFPAHDYMRLEVSGTTLTVKGKATAGASWTTLGTRTNSDIASGAPGINTQAVHATDNGMDTFAAGDL